MHIILSASATGQGAGKETRWRRRLLWLFCLGVLVVTVGCSSRLTTLEIRQGLASGNVDNITGKMEIAKDDHQEFVLALNLARLKQFQGKWRESITAYNEALAILEEYEARAVVNMREILGGVGTIFFSRGAQGYYGTGYERSLLHTFNALNYLMLQDFEGAAVEMRKMEKRQEFWLEEQEFRFRDRADDLASFEVQKDLLKENATLRDLLENPELKTLVNNYQDAFSYALSAIICQLAEDAVYSEVSQGRACALNDEAGSLFGKQWRGKGGRLLNRAVDEQEVLLIVFGGLCPALRINKVRVPFPVLGYVMIDLPGFVSSQQAHEPEIAINGRDVRMLCLLDVDRLAHRTLQDEISFETTAAISRATMRTAIAAGAGVAAMSNKNTRPYAELIALFTNIALDIGSTAASESFRNWEVLPSTGYISLVSAPRGSSLDIRLGRSLETLHIPDKADGCIVIVSQIGNANMRVDYVTY